MVQPRVPWPVLAKSFRQRVSPMIGTLPGVAGRSPAQVSMPSRRPARGKIENVRLTMASQRAPLMLYGDN